MTLDARTPSDYGTVRTYIATRVDWNTGVSSGVQSPYADISAKDYISLKTASPVMEAAYIQFAGFTAGRMPEVFAGDFFGNMMGYQHFPSFASGVIGMSYTALLGGGLSATVGIEDNSGFDGQNASVQSPIASVYVPAVGKAPVAMSLGAPYQTPYDALPLIAGKLNWDQSWGQIQVSGAVAQNRGVYLQAKDAVTVGDYDVTQTGYAFGGQLTLNADMIAKGDKFYLLGGYSNGINKLGFKIANKDGESRNVDGIPQSYTNFTCNATALKLASTVGGSNTAAVAPTQCENTKSTWVTTAFLHYWTPTIRQNIVAGMAWVDPGSIARAAASTTQKTTFSQLGTNVFWSPVRGLDLGVEVMYDRTNVGQTSGLGCLKSSGVTAGCSASGDNFITRLRVQRDF
jgi:hypothetical protein